MKSFTKENVQEFLEVFDPYRKTLNTMATRIEGPFEVETLEGIMTCQDGWLALDVQGNPYPIDRDVFERTYEEVV